jgi:hypothetical protein
MKQKESRFSRRKPRKYKAVQGRVNKPTRRQMTPTERAFVVGACIAGGSTHPEAAAYFPHATTSAIQSFVSASQSVQKQRIFSLPMPHCMKMLLDAVAQSFSLLPRQKRAFVKIVTSDRAHREK